MALAAVPLAMALISVCNVETANRITAVVRSSVDLISITGSTEDNVLMMLVFTLSVMVRLLPRITLFSTLVIKVLVSISILVEVSVYSVSSSSAMALK